MRNMRIGVWIVLQSISTILPQFSNAQNRIDGQLIGKTGQEIRHLLVAPNKSRFNGSILIAKDGIEILRQYYGWTDVDGTTLIDVHSRFNVGSLAKEIPSMSILDLVVEGQLSFDDTVDKYIKEMPEWSKRITISDLLFYKSGLPHINFRVVQSDKQAWEEFTKMTRLPFEPGSTYFYSNWNNFILAQIVEKITNLDFEKWVRTKYFDKLKINSSFYDSTSPEETSHMTKSFTEKFGNDETGNIKFKRFRLCYAPLYMTIGDVLKWVEFIRFKYAKWGQVEQQFYKPTTVDQQGPLGVLQHKDGQVDVHLHGGYAYSFGCSIYRNYENGIALILMTNKNEGIELPNLNDKILEILERNGIE